MHFSHLGRRHSSVLSTTIYINLPPSRFPNFPEFWVRISIRSASQVHPGRTKASMSWLCGVVLERDRRFLVLGRFINHELRRAYHRHRADRALWPCSWPSSTPTAPLATSSTAEMALRALPWLCDCEVNKILSLLERCERYR